MSDKVLQATLHLFADTPTMRRVPFTLGLDDLERQVALIHRAAGQCRNTDDRDQLDAIGAVLSDLAALGRGKLSPEQIQICFLTGRQAESRSR